MFTFSRPATGEFAPFYQRYIDRVPEGDLLDVLETQLRETTALLEGASPEQAAHRYAPGKWSVKEVIGHMTDVERVMAYRALRIARGDATPLPGFDENAYVARAGFDGRPLAELLAAFRATRTATLALLSGFDETMVLRTGTANDAPASARALAYIIAGHERHHVTLLRERYGLG